MKKEKLQAELERVQNRLAIWCVLTICFYVIAALRVLPFIHWLAWLSAGYCFFCLVPGFGCFTSIDILNKKRARLPLAAGAFCILDCLHLSRFLAIIS
ncbi:MAG: hypothetical protein ACIRZW_05830 [Limosilactobacillus mucosae]